MKVLVRMSIVSVLAALVLFGCQTGGGGGGNHKEKPNDEEDVKAVVQEVIEGFLEQTEDAFRNKVFPHISEDYSYAGFDKQALEDDMLEEIESGETLEFGEPTIDQDVEVDGEQATDEVKVGVDVRAPWMEEDFGFVPQGQADIGWTFELVKEDDGEWRITAIKSEATSFVMSGAQEGFEDALPVESKLSVSPSDEVAPGGSVSIQGSVDLKTDDYFYFGWFALEWYDFIPNLFNPSDDPDSIYYYDFSTDKGTFDLSATLPDDGTPEGLEIPGVLNLGDDALRAELAIGALDGDDIAAMLLHMWIIPVRPFENEDLESCDDEPLDGEDHSGIWLLRIPDGNVNDLLDLTIEGDSAVALLGFVDHDNDPPSPAFLPLTGEMTDGDTAALSFERTEGCPPNDPQQIEFTLHFTGTSGNGEFSVSGCGQPAGSADVLLEKLSNRCTYITDYDDILGDDWVFVNFEEPGEQWTMVIDEAPGFNCYSVLLNDVLPLRMCRALNIAWGVIAPSKNGSIDFGFAFHNTDSGVAVISDYNTGDYLLTEFYR